MDGAKIFLTTVLTLLTLTLIVAVIPTERDGAIYSDTLRLHILANSDSTADQQLKVKIRDRLVGKYSDMLSAEGSKEAAEDRLSGMLETIREDVDAWLLEEGYSYRSSVRLSEEWYERRSYGEITLPEGYYTSLVVELGEGDGQNWWCVMYPPLCLEVATEDAKADDALYSYTDQELSLIAEGEYSVRFKLLELTSEIFKAR